VRVRRADERAAPKIVKWAARVDVRSPPGDGEERIALDAAPLSKARDSDLSRAQRVDRRNRRARLIGDGDRVSSACVWGTAGVVSRDDGAYRCGISVQAGARP